LFGLKIFMHKPVSYLVPTLLFVTSNLFMPGVQAAPKQSKVPKISGAVASVNPLVGTAEHGHTYPGATMPFGMVQVSPDTPLQGWDGSSGYHYSDSSIRGFSHTHLSGTGVGGLGDVLLMPTVGALQLSPGTAGKGDGYASRFSHSKETASPGYYKVFLDDPKVTAELTATERSGFHKYTFPASDAGHIILDLQHGVGNSVAEAGLEVENSTTISGYRYSDGWGGRRAVYFVMEFSRPFDSYGIEQDGTRLNTDAKKSTGKSVKAFANYKTGAGETIYVKVGISGTGIEGARKNLSAEIPGWDFNAVHGAAVKKWDDLLGSMKIETRNAKVRRTFYSNLYQSLISPVLFNDVDGNYRGGDKKNHMGSFQNYTTFSLWDTFRAQQPLLTILTPNRISDMVNAMVALDKERGQNEMPVWPLWGNETGTMIGYHSAPVVVDAYLKGFKGFDAEAAFQALKATALNGRNGQDDYAKYGYVVSGGRANQSVSRTLEFAFDDWCIAKMAAGLGHTADADLFYKRAANFMNIFDSTTGFMRGRRGDGSWRRPFNPKQHNWADYTEANAWQYHWSVMHDAPQLVKIMGGDKAFVDRMEMMFNEKEDVLTNIPDITGLIGQYAHGNEPVHHAAYLYNYAGAPYKTAQRVRQIISEFYTDTPAGAPGNNDCGQMSAWYVFSALGFYPVNPTSGVYVIGSPVVDKATIRLDKSIGGKTFTVVADNNSDKNIYVQSVTLNGKPLQNSWFTHAQMLAGGELHFKMGPTPNLSWGNAPANRPLSGMPLGFPYPALPSGATNQATVWTLPIRVAPGSDNAVGNWLPDYTTDDGALNNNGNAIDTSAPNAAPAEVYQTERYGSDITYTYPVPAGAAYTVRLHFAEIFGAAVGERLENVAINGKEVLSKLDIAGEVGQNKALVKEFTGITPDAKGNIVIRITAAPGAKDTNAKVSGIEIFKP
jgi:predicted alpha-1,2-mannosidase